MKFKCVYCKKAADRPSGEVNRALRRDLPLYCNRECSGKGRRKHKTKAQKKAEKAAYDSEYRAKNAKFLKAAKALHFKQTYDPAKAAIERKKRMPKHVEYCRQPAYKAYKQGYDRQYRANREYGPYAEAFILLMDIDKEVNSRMSDYDVRIANGTLNKKLQRRRDHV